MAARYIPNSPRFEAGREYQRESDIHRLVWKVEDEGRAVLPQNNESIGRLLGLIDALDVLDQTAALELSKVYTRQIAQQEGNAAFLLMLEELDKHPEMLQHYARDLFYWDFKLTREFKQDGTNWFVWSIRSTGSDLYLPTVSSIDWMRASVRTDADRLFYIYDGTGEKPELTQVSADCALNRLIEEEANAHEAVEQQKEEADAHEE